MTQFNKGDQVLVNGSLLAEILHYEENGQVVYVSNPPGGGTDTVYVHASQVRLEKVPTLDDAVVEATQPGETVTLVLDPAKPVDVLTTSTGAAEATK